MSVPQIRLRIDSILQFMQPYWPWVNCHMVNFLTDNHWLNFVPLDLQKEVESGDCIDECIDKVFWSEEESLGDNNKYNNCLKFKQQAREHSLHNFKDILMTQDDFEQKILSIEPQSHQQIKIKEFLTEKKRHEVEVTAGLVNNLIESSLWQNHILVVDAGDGKGYLSSRLSLEYGLKVLGIDSNPLNTENALERSKKLQKAWNGLKERADLESKGVTPPRRGNWKEKRKQKSVHENQTQENVNYKTADKFISSDMNLLELIHEKFPETLSSTQPPSICITGLHTCGNLAPTCLKLFHSQPQCKLICNIGCCYHLLNEKYSGPEFFGNKHIEDLNPEIGFPLSKYLQEKLIKIGRNARMLAAQSIERTLAAKELPNISLYYRALLEMLICDEHPELKDTVQVGKIRKFNNFEDYVAMCSKKYPNLNLTKEKINLIEKEEEIRGNRKYLDLFYLLRMTFAPVLETLILLDRLLYLQEIGHTQSYLISVFDPVVSPRHFAIVAIKSET